MNIKLVHDRLRVFFNGFHRDMKKYGDLLLRISLRDVFQGLPLSCRERLGAGGDLTCIHLHEALFDDGREISLVLHHLTDRIQDQQGIIGLAEIALCIHPQR